MRGKYLTALTNTYLIFISLFIIFGRSFSGIYIYSFRLAELIIGFLVIFSFILVIVQQKNIYNLDGFHYQFKFFRMGKKFSTAKIAGERQSERQYSRPSGGRANANITKRIK